MTNNDFGQPGFGQTGFPGGPNPAAQVLAPATKGRRGRRGRGGDMPGRRSASSMRWLFLIFAAAVGVLGVLVTAAPSAQTYVIRSKAAVAPLTALDKSQFEIVGLDPRAVEPDTFSGTSSADVERRFMDAIADTWLLHPLGQGQQVRASMLVPAGDLAVPLAADERLISISARAANAVAGSITPGSIVDVYVSDSNGLTGVLGQAVEIVSVSLAPEQFDSVAQQQFREPEKSLSDFIGPQPVGGTYVIRVKASTVVSYIAADTAGKITLTLHGSDSQAFVPTPTDLLQTICGIENTDPACVRAGQ